ncbi:hypothetical protein G6F31_019888 [Rhizopus arrhizus]|nr:hypothetical protein G6F31_019888 [Rhizopus arrhizus]
MSAGSRRALPQAGPPGPHLGAAAGGGRLLHSRQRAARHAGQFRAGRQRPHHPGRRRRALADGVLGHRADRLHRQRGRAADQTAGADPVAADRAMAQHHQSAAAD